MANTNNNNGAAVAASTKDMNRAKMALVLPCLGQMNAAELATVGLNPAAVEAVMQANGGQPAMHGVSAGVELSGISVMAQRAIDRFYEILAPVDAFSTTYSQDYVVQGSPNVLPKLIVPIYSDEDGAEVDNYEGFDKRTDSGKVTCAEVELHKIDKVIRVYGRDIEQGVDLEKRMEAAASAIAREVQKYVFGGMKVGTAQADNADAKIVALEVPAVGTEEGSFNFGYANQTLSEAIQPRVNAMLVDSAHYGALKASSKDSLTAKDLDMDGVYKVQNTDAFGTGCVGLLANRRGAVVGIAAPYMLSGAYASYQQLSRGGQNIPLAVCTWFDANNNCINVWMGTMVGVKVTDASAIKLMVTKA